MKWFVLRVAGRQVDRVISTIGEPRCWRPMETMWTKPARKHKPIQVQRPLIPGWLFVHEDQYGLWDELDGVHGVLSYGRLGPIWIEDEDLDGLRESCECRSEAPQRQPEVEVEPIPVGSTVRVKGPFYAQLGVLEEHCPGGYSRVSFGPMTIQVASRLIEQG